MVPQRCDIYSASLNPTEPRRRSSALLCPLRSRAHRRQGDQEHGPSATHGWWVCGQV